MSEPFTTAQLEQIPQIVREELVSQETAARIIRVLRASLAQTQAAGSRPRDQTGVPDRTADSAPQ